MAAAETLGTVDYIVLCIMLGISLGIGIFFAIREKDTKEGYLLGNRQMGVFSVAVSMFVTLASAISLLGVPVEIYTFGSMAMYQYVAMASVYIVGMYTCLPLMYPLGITSVYEAAYMAIALLSPALALQTVAGLPLWWSIVIVGLVGTIYTSIGGIKSVVWTDVFQSFIMLAGIVTSIVLGVVRSGGVLNVLRIATQERRLELDEINPDPRVRHTLWGLLIGAFFNWFVNLFTQSVGQRTFAIKSLKGAKMCYLLNTIFMVLYGLLLWATGLVLFGFFYTQGCDPYEDGDVTNRNQLMPYYVMQILSTFPGATGLYMSTLFSGALSTVSSGINALAANTVEDVLGPSLRRIRSERLVTIVAKVSVCFFGLLAIGLAYAAKSLQGPVTQMAMSAFGACGGPVMGMFLLGALVPWSNKIGAFSGGLISLILNVWMSISANIYGARPTTLPPAPMFACQEDVWNSTTTYSNASSMYEVTTVPTERSLATEPFNFSDVSYCWYGLAGTLTAMLLGCLISLITGRTDPMTLDPDLVFPFVRKMCKLRPPLTTDDSLVSTAEYKAMTVRNSRNINVKF
ncbi:sodium-coupled monocarboxylate transporter 2-like [Haliotis rubra]|uniref:sodium-coupled monocarboxylate transporter 2-like n=1 Tax=Haliotis rubra TaxID=36100 RepID=UPI001EE57D0D|nr:sodium-coupled monocarboxylate transporter 2-like [Haliotis rubra]